MHRSLLAAVTLVSIVTGANGQSDTPRIDKRQANQGDRIEAGKKSGALNEREAARLARGQGRVDTLKDNAASDGKTTATERAKIRQLQNDLNKRIIDQKNDAQAM